MSYKPKNVLLIFVFVVIFKNATSLAPPHISISFPDDADKDFVNETMAIMSNSNPVFEMLCTADYPVEWIFHYNPEDDGTSEDTKLANTHRLTDNFLDRSSYRFSAKIRLGYKGKLLSLANFTCRETGSSSSVSQGGLDPLETNVIMLEENQKSLIILKITSEKLEEPLVPHREINGNCSRAVAKTFQDFDYDLVPCFRCEIPEGGKKLELDYVNCITPIQCASTYPRQNKGTSCLRRMEDYPDDCRRINPDFNSKMVLCKNYGATLVQFYFFAVFREDIDDESVGGQPVYFNWEEADPLQMLFIHPINRSIVYQDENMIFTCEYSRYYFSLGSWFGIENDTGIEYIKAIDRKPCDSEIEKTDSSTNNCTVDESWRGTFRASLEINFNALGSHQVYCFGPVWNTTDWVNASLAFTVEPGEPPMVLSVKADNPKEDFIVGQQHRKLVCEFSGTPIPTVSWTGPGNKTNYMGHQVSDYINELKFSEIGYQSSGQYTCTVTSYLGNHSKSFLLESHGEAGLSTASIILISVAVCVVCGFILLLIFQMRRIIIAQREELRVLTEAEMKEFLLGNPEILEEERRVEHFSRPLPIDSLPYDKKYEIDVENIFIDYNTILGSGQFGIVFKGKVSPEIALHYVNVTRQSYVTLPESIEVAIKVCRGTVDVQSFKALLTEIKVMAYLGTHDNIVSLIGASTQNIRNSYVWTKLLWEIYVAVEYCHNGSLDIFLKKHKADFVNDLNSKEARDQLTLRKLYEWTSDMAEGLEYIHGKRIIHADLATRNILLTLNLRAKIGDFGLSRQLLESSSYTKTTKCPLPWRNMAVESLKNLEFSVKSDMWAFGVTLWELFTLGDTPYPGLNYTIDFTNLLERGLRLYKPPIACNALYDYMLMCWNITPGDRPPPSEVKMVCLKTLEHSSNNLTYKNIHTSYVQSNYLEPLLND